MKNKGVLIALAIVTVLCIYFVIGGNKTPNYDLNLHKIDSLKVIQDSLILESVKSENKIDSINRAYDSLIVQIKNYKHEKINHIKSLSIDSSIMFLREELSREDSFEW